MVGPGLATIGVLGVLLLPGIAAGQSAATHVESAGAASDAWTIDRSHSRVGEVETYPELRFESPAIRRVADDEFVVEGELTIRDVTRPIELTARLLGIRAFDGEMARHGRMVAGFAATGVIDRGDFGVGSGRWAETVVLGPEVTIDVLLEARQP